MAKVGDEKIRGPEQIEWHKWFRSEQDNLASAMERALKSPMTLEKGCRLVCAVCWYWGIAGDFTIMKYWLELALSRSSSLGETPIKANLLFNSGLFSVWGMTWLEPIRAQEAIEKSMEIFHTWGPEFFCEHTQCLAMLGYIRKSHYNDDKGYEYMDQAIDVFRRANDIWWQAWTLSFYGMIMVSDNKDFEAIYQLLEEEIALWTQTGDKFSLGFPIADLGALYLRHGEFLDAKKQFQRSLQIAREFKAKPFILELLQYLGKVALGLKEYEKAKVCFEESLLLSQETRWDNWLFSIHHGLGYVSLHLGENKEADKHFHYALKLAMDFGSIRNRLLCIAGFASLAAVRNESGIAARLFGVFFAQIEALLKVSKPDNNLIDSVNQIEIDEHLVLCRSQIEENTFKTAWNAGRAMNLDETLNEVSTMFMRVDID